MFVTTFICHSIGKTQTVTIATKRNIYKLDKALLKELNLEDIYTQKMTKKLKYSKNESSWMSDNQIFNNSIVHPSQLQWL
jgi:hypothetical protein